MTSQKIRLSSIETEKPESEEYVVEITEDEQKVKGNFFKVKRSSFFQRFSKK